MRALFIGRGLKIRIELKPFCLSNSCKRFSYSNDGPSDMDVHKESEGPFKKGRWTVSDINAGNGQTLRKHEVVRRTVENVCHVLESGPWGPSLEKTLSSVDDKPQADVVIGVLRRMKNVDLGVNYFRWVERVTNQVNSPETYNSLLMLMARCKKFDRFEHVFEEMSLAGFSPSVETSVELVSSCVKAQRLRDAFDLIQTMRKFKFRPGFSAYKRS
ncbi:Pentatricopeptide repeat-containing protein [Sesamum angolense]|uniref:Pentatricopeptide repeat-containing protein n=1 Tax=Sesamum angolense TaxID=2727404 RepID=A0AAE1X5C8_9LAMI|nr:Pentatricopeptide repeat-containing protein [Sesamum angolense]